MPRRDDVKKVLIIGPIDVQFATGASAASLGIEARLAGTEEVRSLQACHAAIV